MQENRVETSEKLNQQLINHFYSPSNDGTVEHELLSVPIPAAGRRWKWILINLDKENYWVVRVLRRLNYAHLS